MFMPKYVRFSKNYKINKLIPEGESPYKYIDDINSPYFISMIRYNEEQYEKWKNTKSLSGMSNGTTNKIWADFDSEKDLEKAFKECEVFVSKLFDLGFTEENVQISFSGSKGVGVLVETEQEYTINQIKNLCNKLAVDMETFDTSMYDHQRIFRLLFTKNEKTGLYKIPITFDELKQRDIEDIKSLALDISQFDQESVLSAYKKASVKLPEKLINEDIEPARLEVVEPTYDFDLAEVDFVNKPTYLDKSRWLLMNGYFRGSATSDVGERSHAFLCLASTLKNVGYDKEVVYRMLKGVAELQSKRTGEERYPDSELYNNIVMQVFGPHWKNGQFTTKDPNSWLYKYAARMGVLEKESTDPIQIGDVEGSFTHYVKNIDKNTIRTGIEKLDKAMPITVGMNLGIIGAAASGKTAIALEILKNTSQAGVTSVFASLDMHRNRLFEKLLYKVTGLSREDIYKEYQEGRGKELTDKVRAEYGNVWFYDRSCPTVSNIRDYVLEVEQKTGEKVKMVMLDYFERIVSDVSDDTASSKRIAGELQDLVNDLDICLITLVQPNKFSLGGGPDSPIKTYTAIKGSSFLYQSFRSIISIWRPFFTPDTAEKDKYLQMAILKNDLGELNTFDFKWNGKKGEIRDLEDFESRELEALLEEKYNEQKESKKKDPFGY